MCFDDSIKMTVTEDPEYHEPFKMTELNPFLSSDYAKRLMQIGGSSHKPTSDMEVDIGYNLAEAIAKKKKELDEKNGIKELESKDMYHNQIDL